MKKSSRGLLPLLVLVALVLQGCETSGAASRAQEKATTFNQLSPAVQKHLQQGNVEYGYTDDMVYIALGKPSKIETKNSADGPVTVWVYKNMVLPNSGGYQGLTYNHATGIVPSMGSPMSGSQMVNPNAASPGVGSPKYATQVNNATNPMAESVELPDLPTGTLYIFIFMGKVIKMNLDT